MSNPISPNKSTLFEPVKDTYGSRLALVFGNEFKGGECPFYTAKQCHHCDIGAGEGTQFTTKMNRERLDFFRQHSKPNRPRSPSERKVFLGQLDSSSVIVDSWPDWQKSAFGVI